MGCVAGSIISSGYSFSHDGLTAQKCSHVATFVMAAALTSVLPGLLATRQPTTSRISFLNEGTPVDERNGTDGDSGAGLTPPPSAKLIRLLVLFKNVALMISPYDRSCTTRTNTLRTLSSGRNTSGSSNDPAIYMGGVALLPGLAALSHHCPLELTIDCPPLSLSSTDHTKASEAYFPPPAPVSTNTFTGIRQLVFVWCHTNAMTHTCLAPQPTASTRFESLVSATANSSPLFRSAGLAPLPLLCPVLLRASRLRPWSPSSLFPSAGPCLRPCRLLSPSMWLPSFNSC